MADWSRSKMSFDIRRLELGDEKTWREAVEAIISTEDRENRLISLSNSRNALGDDRCYLVLAYSNSAPIGLLTAYRFPDTEGCTKTDWRSKKDSNPRYQSDC